MQARLAELDAKALDLADPKAPADQLVQPHAADHHLTARLAAAETDVLQHLRLDQRQRLARLGAALVEVAVALEPLARQRAGGVDPGDRVGRADIDRFDVHPPIMYGRPPPPHKVAAPYSTWRRRISCTSVTIIRAPVEPRAWPSATEPPLTFTISWSAPSMRVACRATEAKASLTSSRPRSCRSLPAFLSAFSSAIAGTVCRYANRSAHIPCARISASGSTPSASARWALITTMAAAPSESCEAFPAVMVPAAVNAGGSSARDSYVVRGRMPSSRSTTAVSPARPWT